MLCKKCGNAFEPQKGLINYCSLQCRNSRTWNEEDKEKKRRAVLDNPELYKHCKESFAKGLKNRIYTKVERFEVICSICNEKLITTKTRNQKYHSNCYKTIIGGYKQGSGYSKSGWYKGVWCDSSYELAWVIYNLDHDILFKRNNKPFKYEFNGDVFNYYPDFIQNGTYIEIKGYHTDIVDAKAITIPGLVILYKNDLTKEFDYVINTYGKDFIELYEGNPHKLRNNECKVCGNPAKKIYCSKSCSLKGNRLLSKKHVAVGKLE